VRWLSGFRWSPENKRISLIVLPLIAMVFLGFYVLPFTGAVCLGTFAVLLSTAYSIRVMLKLVALNRVPRSMRGLVVALGVVHAKSELPFSDV
jgi:antigen flippase